LIHDFNKLILELKNSAEHNDKLLSISGGEDLLQHMEEILFETTVWSKNIASTIDSPSVYYALKTLHTTLGELKVYLNELEKKSFIFSRSKVKAKIQKYYHTIRAKCTQLETSMTLILVNKQGAGGSSTPVIATPSELYNIGVCYFHGLRGMPKNYVTAMEKFVLAAKEG